MIQERSTNKLLFYEISLADGSHREDLMPEIKEDLSGFEQSYAQ